jgi:tetratricopeptide (TPR) repeat protein
MLGRHTEGIAAIERAIASEELLGDSSDPMRSNVRALNHSNLANEWAVLGRPDRELEERRLARELYEKACEALPNSSLLRSNLAYVLKLYAYSLERLGRTHASLKFLERAAGIYRRVYDEDSSDVFAAAMQFECLNRIAEITRATGRPTAAVEGHEEVLTLLEDLSRRGIESHLLHYFAAETHRGLGDALFASELWEGALRHHREAARIAEALVGEAHDDVHFKGQPPIALRHLALSLQRSGDLAGAVGAARRSVELFGMLPSQSAEQLFELACAHAVLSGLAGRAGSPVPAAAGRAEGHAAMDALRRALVPGNVYPDRLRTDPALDPIRDRDDFRMLMQDVGFPTWPFAID